MARTLSDGGDGVWVAHAPAGGSGVWVQSGYNAGCQVGPEQEGVGCQVGQSALGFTRSWTSGWANYVCKWTEAEMDWGKTG